MSAFDLSEQELVRRNSLKELYKLGINPYPADLYPVSHYSKQIKEEYNAEANNLQNVCIAGRVMSRRIMGSASFFELKDKDGRIQVYIRRDDICPGEDKTL